MVEGRDRSRASDSSDDSAAGAIDAFGVLVDHGPTVAFGSSGLTDLYTDSSLTSAIDASTRWQPGMSLYAACPNPGDVAVTVKIDGTIVYDGEVECRE